MSNPSKAVAAATVAALAMIGCGPVDSRSTAGNPRSATSIEGVSAARAFGALAGGIVKATENIDVISEMRGETDTTLTRSWTARDALDSASAAIDAVASCPDPAAEVSRFARWFHDPFDELSLEEVDDAMYLDPPFENPEGLAWTLSNACGRLTLFIEHNGYRLLATAGSARWTLELQSRWVGYAGRDPAARINQALAAVYQFPAGYDGETFAHYEAAHPGVSFADFLDHLAASYGPAVESYLAQRDGNLTATLNIVAATLLNADAFALIDIAERGYDAVVGFAPAADIDQSVAPSAMIVRHSDSTDGFFVESYEEHWRPDPLSDEMPTRLGRLRLCSEPAYDTITASAPNGTGPAISIGLYTRSRIEGIDDPVTQYYMVEASSLQIVPVQIDCDR